MSPYPFDEQSVPYVISLRDQPVLVASDVEDQLVSYLIGRRQIALHVRVTGPIRPLGKAKPRPQRAFGVRMAALPELTQPSHRDDPHNFNIPYWDTVLGHGAPRNINPIPSFTRGPLSAWQERIYVTKC